MGIAAIHNARTLEYSMAFAGKTAFNPLSVCRNIYKNVNENKQNNAPGKHCIHCRNAYSLPKKYSLQSTLPFIPFMISSGKPASAISSKTPRKA